MKVGSITSGCHYFRLLTGVGWPSFCGKKAQGNILSDKRDLPTTSRDILLPVSRQLMTTWLGCLALMKNARHLFRLNRSTLHLAVFLCWIASSHAKEPLIISDYSDDIVIDHFRHTSYLKGYTELKAIEVLDIKEWQNFRENQTGLGIQKHSYWFHVKIESNTKKIRDLIFSIKNPNLDIVHFYVIKNRELVDSFLTGDLYNYYSRPLYSRVFSFPFEIKPKDNVDLVFRAESKGPMDMYSKLQSPSVKMLDESSYSLLNGMYYGLMMFLAIVTFIMFISTGSIIFFYYVLHNISMQMLFLVISGLAYQNIWPYWPQLNEISILLSSATAALFINIFFVNFLGISKEQKYIYITSKAFLFIYIFIIASMPFSNYGKILLLCLSTSLLQYIFILLVSYYKLLSGHIYARYFCFSWTILFIFSVVIIGAQLGILPSNAFTNNAVKFGVLAEAVGLAVATQDKIKILSKH